MSRSDPERSHPRRLARIVGVCGLIGILTGAFDIGYVQSTLIVAGNAAATLHNISMHEALFRSGVFCHLIEMLVNTLGEVVSFLLFRRVNMIAALIALGCGIIGIAIESVDLLIAYIPLTLAGADALRSFTAGQIQDLTYISAQLQQAGLLISWVFYGLDEIASGFLFFRSRFVPRILGIMLGLSGLCYMIHGLTSFLAPLLDARLFPYILFPCLPGEGLSSLWLATVGLNVARWREWATDSFGDSLSQRRLP